MHYIDELTMNNVASHEAATGLVQATWIQAYMAMGNMVSTLGTDYLIPVVLDERPIGTKRWSWQKATTVPMRWVGIWIAHPTLAATLPREIQKYFRRMKTWDYGIWGIQCWHSHGAATIEARITITDAELFGVNSQLYTQPGYQCQWDPLNDQWVKTHQITTKIVNTDKYGPQVSREEILIAPTPLTTEDIIAPVTQLIQTALEDLELRTHFQDKFLHRK